MKILIDNGHGENTLGKRSPKWPDGTQLFEWAYTREIAQRVESELLKKGIDAERIVKENVDISLSERCKRANAIATKVGVKNCFLVSIHNNAASGTAQGWEVHTYIKSSKTSDDDATVFWETAKELLPAGTKMRRPTATGCPAWKSNFAIIRDTICPAILTENLFMDNPDDCRYLLSPEGKTAIVNIHVQSILKIAGK
ncbi:MAG: Sporulation-specific N-acetylmuramoyl-L-alanine amidase [Candidatus Ordinivivax streblomastigis]|uniref:N-acetylmuramoyl-L-alanine amidase n=1 Tax=Candidatus Ordinivivax streblomastigis TaxID=2540710 RepID=A0A5M8P3Q5_9BACT|nr:MAG: Sporulation-specific N-acetylmuramoyl-L-alanine amidase [Candidatus Ordinivivax streblomastigis]